MAEGMGMGQKHDMKIARDLDRLKTNWEVAWDVTHVRYAYVDSWMKKVGDFMCIYFSIFLQVLSNINILA